MVETAKSTRIFTSALTWFLCRTVPSSRKAKPACMASTMMAPSKMKKTSEPCGAGSMRMPPERNLRYFISTRLSRRRFACQSSTVTKICAKAEFGQAIENGRTAGDYWRKAKAPTSLFFKLRAANLCSTNYQATGCLPHPPRIEIEIALPDVRVSDQVDLPERPAGDSSHAAGFDH